MGEVAWREGHDVRGDVGKGPHAAAFRRGCGDDPVKLWRDHPHVRPHGQAAAGYRDLGCWAASVQARCARRKLYGRGAADDGFGLFAALAPIFVLQQHNIPHPRIVITIEGAEESGSPDIDFYYKRLLEQKKFGDVRLIVILDSGTMDYERVWLTTSLRGVVSGSLTVKILNDGVHSGGGGGIVPDSFRIARQLLNRIEDPKSGKIRLQQLHTKVPPAIVKGLKELNGLSTKLCEPYPFVQGAIPECAATNYDAAMHNWWSPCLTVTGADGLPPTAQAGNVLRPMTRLKLSVRIPAAR